METGGTIHSYLRALVIELTTTDYYKYKRLFNEQPFNQLERLFILIPTHLLPAQKQYQQECLFV